MTTTSLLAQPRSIAAAYFPGPDVEMGDEKCVRLLAEQVAIARPGAGDWPVSTEALVGELLFGAVNYCYWSGKADTKPAGGGSSMLRRMILDRFAEARGSYSDKITAVIAAVSAAGFPLADERSKHLCEVRNAGEGPILWFLERVATGRDIEARLDELTGILPGYASDAFLKRALFFFHLCYRVYGLFEQEIHLLPIPADYQVPKMLAAWGVLKYSHALQEAVAKGEMITSGSSCELQIRSGAVVACRILAEQSGCTESAVDDFLWSRRKSVADPYHLTVTTDY